MQTRCDSLVLWLTLGQAAGVQVPGGEGEALWDDVATAGALCQRQVDLRRNQQHTRWSGPGSTTFQISTNSSRSQKYFMSWMGVARLTEKSLGGSNLQGQKVKMLLDANDEGNETSPPKFRITGAPLLINYSEFFWIKKGLKIQISQDTAFKIWTILAVRYFSILLQYALRHLKHPTVSDLYLLRLILKNKRGKRNHLGRKRASQGSAIGGGELLAPPVR